MTIEKTNGGLGSARQGRRPLPTGRDCRLLSEEVASQIEQYIVEADLRPGDRLPSERQLTARYGVSRTAVRDAIAILEQRGLVVVRPGSGTYVWDGSSAALADVFSLMLRRDSISPRELMETRWLLEVHNAGLAATRATPANLAVIATAMRRTEAAQRPREFVEASFSFHEAIGLAAGNRVLVALLKSLRPLLLHGMLIGAVDDEERPAANRDHAAIYAAIAAGDQEAARRAMAHHLQRGTDIWARKGAIAPDDALGLLPYEPEEE